MIASRRVSSGMTERAIRRRMRNLLLLIRPVSGLWHGTHSCSGRFRTRLASPERRAGRGEDLDSVAACKTARSRRRRRSALVLQQPPLAPDTAWVPLEVTVAPNYPVTR